MTLDHELKESLQLSFKYLRAYDEEQVISAMEGWLDVYGDKTDQGLEEESIETEMESQDLQRDEPVVTRAESDQKTAMDTPRFAATKSPELGRKIVLGISFAWCVLILATLFFILS